MTESLDIEDRDLLLAYLRRQGRIGRDETPRTTNLAGGVSNRTVLLEKSSGQTWVLKQSLEKLRVKADWHSDPRRIEREALGMERLAEICPPGSITPLIFLDRGQHVLAMEAVPRPHENWKTMLLRGRPEPEHVRQFALILAAIHRLGFERRGQFAVEFEDRGFFESLRLEPYYQYSARQMPPAAGFLERLIDETRKTRRTLVHGDFSPKNILIHEGRLVLLDHEVIHFGDGAFDLGFALTHFLSKAHHLKDRRGDFAIAAKLFWSIYRQAIDDVPWATDVEERACRHVLACLLARCVGRSPLEYLTPDETAAQADAVCSMMKAPPRAVAQLVDEFTRRIETR